MVTRACEVGGFDDRTNTSTISGSNNHSHLVEAPCSGATLFNQHLNFFKQIRINKINLCKHLRFFTTQQQYINI